LAARVLTSSARGHWLFLFFCRNGEQRCSNFRLLFPLPHLVSATQFYCGRHVRFKRRSSSKPLAASLYRIPEARIFVESGERNFGTLKSGRQFTLGVLSACERRIEGLSPEVHCSSIRSHE